MNGRFSGHGVKKGNIVHTGTDVREQVGNHFSAFSIGLEIPLGADNSAFVSLSSSAKGLHVNGLAIEGIKLGLVVEGIHVAGSPVHEQKDHRLRLAWKGRVFRSKGIDELGQLLGHRFA